MRWLICAWISETNGQKGNYPIKYDFRPKTILNNRNQKIPGIGGKSTIFGLLNLLHVLVPRKKWHLHDILG